MIILVLQASLYTLSRGRVWSSALKQLVPHTEYTVVNQIYTGLQNYHMTISMKLLLLALKLLIIILMYDLDFRRFIVENIKLYYKLL